MISLDTVRLVNWHFFTDEIIPFGNRSLIAGDNGSGKSTIIDAVQYTLAADLRKARFNQAAGDRRGGRDLAGYVRCKLGSDTTEYLRGDTVAHIMLHFSDNAQGFTAAVCIEAFTDGRTVEHFWSADNITVKEIQTADSSSLPLSFRRFKDTIEHRNPVFFETKREYQRYLTNKLGVFRRMAEYNPYLESFTRSVSFTPLVSVDRFVCDYILEERQLNIQTMKENLESYKEAERHAHATVRRIESLKSIKNTADEYRSFQKQMIHQDYLKALADRTICEENTSLCRKNEENLLFLLESQERALDEKNQTRQKINAELREIQAALSKDDNHQLFIKLKEDIANLKRQADDERKKAQRFYTIRSQCRLLMQTAGLMPAESDETAASDVHTGVHPDESAGIAQNNEVQLIDSDKKILETARKDAEQALFTINAKIKETETVLRETASEIEDLERGIRRFPEYAKKLTDELTAHRIQAWILADLAEVTDPEWANAVEGWLNTLRFAVIVEPSTFQQALELYNSLPRHISGAALPNIAKMRDKTDGVKKGSLAELVSSDNPWARIYLNSLLGDVMPADISTLKNYAKSITKECMSYSNHTATRIREEVWKDRWLGRAAREQRKDFLHNEQIRLRREYAELTAERTKTAEKTAAFAAAFDSLSEARHLADSPVKAAVLDKEIHEKETELNSLDISSSKELERKCTVLEQRRSEIEIERDKLNIQFGENKGQLKALREKTIQLTAELSRYEEVFNTFCTEHEADVSSCEAYAADRLRTSSARSVLETFAAGRKGLDTKAENASKNYNAKITAYNAEFSTIIPPDIEQSGEITDTLERLERSELPEYRERISRARSDAEREFKDHFIAKLNEYIIDAKESFKEINETLKSMTFGRDQYSFTLEEKADRRAQIHVIQKAAEISAYEDGLFTQIIDPAEREATESLFQTIISSDLDSVEMRSICDYRTYFTYDIRMRDTQTIDPVTGKAAEMSLSRVLREKSGGESQTPYYVAIAASFYRFFKDKEETAVRFILFDEAFDKLDDERIGKVIDFYARMGIQLAVAVPTEKIESIAPKMDQINLVIRHGHNAHVRTYTSSSGDIGDD